MQRLPRRQHHSGADPCPTHRGIHTYNPRTSCDSTHVCLQPSCLPNIACSTLDPIADSPAPTLNQASMFIGDGMGPLPSKVVTRIFIEMREPLLENGPDLYTEDQAKLYVFLGKEKAPLVANILTCTECFSAHSRSVLLNIQRSFSNSWHIIMYLIVKCHKCFEVLGWFNYDRAVRRQARSLNWSKTDSTLLASPSLEKQGRQHLVSCV